MKATNLLLLCLFTAMLHSMTAEAQTPKYKFPNTLARIAATGNFHDMGAPKVQWIYRPSDLPGLPEVEIKSIYLRVGVPFKNPNPTIFKDIRIKMGYTKDTGFLRKTGEKFDSFKTNVKLVFYQPSVTIYGANTPGTWVRFPVSNFAYSRSENLVVEISRGYQAIHTAVGFDWMAKNNCNMCALEGQYDSARVDGPGGFIYQADIGFNDSTGSASVPTFNNLHGFYTYPNPNNGLFTVGFEPSRTLEPIVVSVADMAGRQVWQRVYNDVQADLFTANVDLQNMPKGVYMLHIQKGADRAVQRVVLE